jgi:hypothetical protein
MKSRALLFLDFDGVLHPASAYQTHAFSHAPALARCVAPYDCEIVISSSWRFSYTLDELRSLLPRELAMRVTGATGPAHVGSQARYIEICKYLQKRMLQTDAWRALDDAAWEFPHGLRNLVSCDPNVGLAERQLLELEQWFISARDRPGSTSRI